MELFGDKSQYLTTIFAGNKAEGKPTLVLVHGFGGSASLFYRVFKELSEHFYVIAFDIIGMGSSSRPVFECLNATDSNAFMLRIIEEWRK